MRNVILNLRGIETKQALHEALAEGFAFPDYYGKNLDALYDCLTDISEETDVEVFLGENSELESYCSLVLKVLEEAAEENDSLRIVLEDRGAE